MAVIITYENEHKRQWSEQKVFLKPKKAKEFLFKKGFREKGGYWFKGPQGWSKGLKAYVCGVEIVE